MADVAIRSGERNEGSTGYEYRTNGVVIFSSKVNKSCDLCLRAKRKCDRKLPCSRCIGKGHAHVCNYSRRKPHKPHKSHQWKFKGHGVAALSENSAPNNSRPRMVRARLRPSPATGLVGMKENAFLSDFFGGIGFLPLTSQSNIREIIVKMMTGLELTSGFDHPNEEIDIHHDGISSSCVEWGVSRLVTGSSACVLWSAIALGALVKGVPSEEVDTYRRMAETEVYALSPLSAEAVGAWAILGFMHGFLGDKEEFSRCLNRADALIDARKENGYKEPFPIGMAEIVKWSTSMTACGMRREDVRALSAEEISPPEMSSYPTEAEVYRYMVAADRAGVQVCARISMTEEEAAQRDAYGINKFGTTETPPNEPDIDISEESLIEKVPLDAKWDKFKESPFDLDILEKAVTQSLKDGVGGAMINMVLSTMVLGEFDKEGLFEIVKHLVDVTERYPGLFRFVHWLHVPHHLAAFLARIGDPRAQSFYDRVRAAYNPVKVASFRDIPPFEEWRGVSPICGDPACSVAQETCYAYLEQLNRHAKRDVDQRAVQVDDSNPGDTSSVEPLHDANMLEPISPYKGNRCVSHGEEDKSEGINVSIDGDIEIEILSTLASCEPAALEDVLFSQRETIDLKISPSKSGDQRMPSPISLSTETSNDGEIPHVDSTDANGKMVHSVCSPVSYTKRHDMDATKEMIDAEDWLEAIDAFHSC